MKMQRFIVEVLILALLVASLSYIIITTAPVPTPPHSSTSSQPAAAAAATTTTAIEADAVTTTAHAAEEDLLATTTPNSTITDDSSQKPQIHRIENPYVMPPLTFETINELSRAALVNIFCTAKNGSIQPISGSGTIIDPKGIILTNAHVAQYVLLARSGQTNLSCVIRTGSPAGARYVADVMYLPPAWIREHAADLRNPKPLGTGAHDYALLAITRALDGSELPARFPYLPHDAREAIGFIGDRVLVASYPAEFIGPGATNNLYAATSLSNIGELLTLGESSVDVISVGGVIEAQSGSSGGAILNAWGRIIGVITTTSDGVTTAERDLRGITLSYIDRDIAVQSAYTLSELLAGNHLQAVEEYKAKIAPAMVELLLEQLRN